jgi:hypothetical protein
MRSLDRRRLLVTSLALLGGLAGGCLAPTLPPLPPPAAKVSAPVDGQVEVSGAVLDENAGAMVLSLNNQSGEVGGQLLEHGETRFSFKMRAQVDDVLTVFYLVHNEQSDATNLTVRADDSTSPADSSAPAPGDSATAPGDSAPALGADAGRP